MKKTFKYLKDVLDGGLTQILTVAGFETFESILRLEYGTSEILEFNIDVYKGWIIRNTQFLELCKYKETNFKNDIDNFKSSSKIINNKLDSSSTDFSKTRETGKDAKNSLIASKQIGTDDFNTINNSDSGNSSNTRDANGSSINQATNLISENFVKVQDLYNLKVGDLDFYNQIVSRFNNKFLRTLYFII